VTPAWITTSWDDGHPLDFRVAELLTKYGLAGTFYVPRTAETQVMNEAQIHELSKQFEIGAHTLNHVYLNSVPGGEANFQIAGSKSWVEDTTGNVCNVFCFPGGKFRHRHFRMLQSAGFQAARTAELLNTSGPATITASLCMIPTTVQAFPHPRLAYLRNAVRRMSTPGLAATGALLRSSDWTSLARRLLRRTVEVGGVFHVWGHSWEIDLEQQWRHLEDFFKFAASCKSSLRVVGNGQLADEFASQATRQPSGTKPGENQSRTAYPSLSSRTVAFNVPGDPPFWDGKLAELDENTRAMLARASKGWLGSLGFCEWYCSPPAHRAAYISSQNGQIEEACFYRIEKWAGVFSRLHILGPLDLESPLMLKLKIRHSPDLVSVSRCDSALALAVAGAKPRATIQRMSEDYCVNLPETPAAFLSKLGARTRKHLPYYLRRLQREWKEEWRFDTANGKDISKSAYLELLDLNQQRMSKKLRSTLWHPQLADRRWNLVQEAGLLCSISYRGKLVAGTLSFRHKREAYLSVIAHHPAYDKLNLGNLCLWMTIDHCIANKFSKFHLLWGDSLYKRQFGGESHPLYMIVLAQNMPAAIAWRMARAMRIQEGWSLGEKAARKIKGLFSQARKRVRAGERPPLLGTVSLATAKESQEPYGFPVKWLSVVLCPKDDSPLSLLDAKQAPRVVQGIARCPKCSARFEIREGILRLLPAQGNLDLMTSREQEARDERAGGYDARFRDWENTVEVAALLAEAPSIADKVVLDVACGTGRLTRRLLPLVRTILAADLSEESLQLFAKKLPATADVGLIWADATRLRFARGTFDTALSTQLFEHLSSPQQRAEFLEGIYLALKEDGTLLLSLYYYSLLRALLGRKQEGVHATSIYYRRYTRAELEREFAGRFRVMQARPIQIDRRLVPGKSKLAAKLATILERTLLPRIVGQLLFVTAKKDFAAPSHPVVPNPAV